MEISTTDIHNHLLPGVDDGFKSADESIKAITLMTEAGCREFCFTPHMNPDVYKDTNEDIFKGVYADFVKKIPSELGITTHLASEYMIVQGFEKRAENPESLLTYPDSSILIEMSYYFRSPNLEKTVFNLRLQGLKPILAHPERYLYMANCLGDFDRLRDMGCRFQMNLLSRTGCYGPESVKILRYLDGKGWYDFRASDLHSLGQLQKILDFKDKDSVLKERSFLSKIFHH